MIITGLGIWSNSHKFTHNTVLLWAQNSHCTVRTGLRHWRQGCQRALLFSTDSSECPNSKLLSLQTPYPTSVLYCGKWRLLSLIPPPPPTTTFFLSSVHSLLPLSTYLVPTEQCRRRRALKDRLDCLGILVSLFLFHILGLMRWSPRLFTQNCVFCASWSREKCLYDFLCSAVRVEN